MSTLYEKIGGEPAVDAAVELFYVKVLADDRIKHFFVNTDMKRQLEKECITRALMDTGGNITKAAKVLGMKRPRLSQLVKQYELAKLLEEIKS